MPLTDMEKWARKTLRGKKLKFTVVFNSSAITEFLCVGKNKPPRMVSLHKSTGRFMGGMLWSQYRVFYSDSKVYTKQKIDGIKKADKWLKEQKHG